MKMKKAELQNVLQKVKPGLAKRDVIEQFTHFIFTGTSVITYNDEICISHPLVTEFQCSAKSDEFFKAVNSIDSDEIDIDLDDEGKINITSNKAKGYLLTTPEEDDAEHLIKALNLEAIGDNWKKLPADFVRGASLSMFSASSDLTKGIYTCVSADGNLLTSADGIRISIYEMEDAVDPFLIPALNVSELVKFDIKYYFISESWAHFKTEDGVVFSSRIMEGDYPSMEEFFNIEGEELELPTKLKGVIDSITFMVDGKTELDKFIDVFIYPDKIECKAQKKNIGQFEKEIDFESNVEKLHLVINPNFLMQVLEKATTVVIGETSVLFITDSFNHIISLV